MQTHISDMILASEAGAEANRILRACVHCGFCTATCPTYQILSDELDGPRGRIYLIKDMLEGGEVTATTQSHLDRCLSCRACESTCPSGVEYAHLAAIGKVEVEKRVGRSLWDKSKRAALVSILPNTKRFAFFFALARLLRPILPSHLRSKVPQSKPIKLTAFPQTAHARSVLLIEGCVQPVMSPEIDVNTAKVLDKLGINVQRTGMAQCCGAVEHHMNAHDKSLSRIRANIDAWIPFLDAGAEAILSTASACALEIKEYAYALRNDAAYADKAKRISAAAKDLVEVLAAEDLSAFKLDKPKRIAFHSPCTLQHGQKINGSVEVLLTRIGYELSPVQDAHLCCGAAGTYTVLQPELSATLRDNKVKALTAKQPEIIATANIGCLHQLQSGSEVPVKHWVSLLAALHP
ncbi:MAG: glycolate oxidase iron-sulfur subunit [Zetaproteobacteria bacterium CG2_30_46_52]|nr:MAG: glycolate oxidase iron-sulfur subunit [Zetaproteobacteria bacterium CG2_30_46_52]